MRRAIGIVGLSVLALPLSAAPRLVAFQIAAENATLRHLEAGEHNLVVMGVSPRPGATLSLGDAAAAVLERSEWSALFVAS
jgi:hypothetical protein